MAALELCVAPLSAQVPVITKLPTSQTAPAGGTVVFTVEVSGAGPFTYQWQHNGTNLPNGIISTVAGGGKDFPGEGGPATSARLRPNSVTVDPFENLFIAEVSGPHGLRKVDTNGIIITVPGQMDSPGGIHHVATDRSGNLFYANARDARAERVRKLGADGFFRVVAGRDETWGEVPLGDGGPAKKANLDMPLGMAFDRYGNLFIAEMGGNRIRKVSTNGIITTIAGNGKQGYSGDGGPATEACLHYPRGVAVDDAGCLYIADTTNKRIRKVGSDGIITTIAGGGTNLQGDGGPATNVDLYIVDGGIAVDGGGKVLFSTFYNIRKVDTNGLFWTVAGSNVQGCSGDGGPATGARLGSPHGIAVDSYGNLFIADDMCGRVRKVGNTQGPGLALHTVRARDAGSYRVVVSGPGGSVTSAAAVLTLTQGLPEPPEEPAAVKASSKANDMPGARPFRSPAMPILFKPGKVPGLVSRFAVTPPTAIDLSAYYNADPATGWTDGNPRNSLSSLPRGLQVLGGVPFDIRGIIQLGGRSGFLGTAPAQMTGIKVAQRCKKLHFLHAVCYGRATNGTEVARLVFHQAGLPPSTKPILFGSDVRDWWAVEWQRPAGHDPATVVWTGPNGMGVPLQLFKSTWENPHPEAAVDSFDFISTVTDAAPFLIAITAEPVQSDPPADAPQRDVSNTQPQTTR
jgi:sugar lactone lactonase YvrE